MALSQEKLYTYADALTWDESERVELIYGVPRMMSPGPGKDHQMIAGELFGELRDYLKGKTCKAFFAPFDVRLFERDGDHPEYVDTVVQPDIMVVCDPNKLDHRGCRGAPDLIIEILSPSTQGHDRVTKFNLYRKAGVQEYWIVDPTGKNVQTYVLENGNYSAKAWATAKDKLKVEVLEDCWIDLSQVFSEE